MFFILHIHNIHPRILVNHGIPDSSLGSLTPKTILHPHVSRPTSHVSINRVLVAEFGYLRPRLIQFDLIILVGDGVVHDFGNYSHVLFI